MTKLNKRDLKYIKDSFDFLIEQAENWRGSLLGNPNPLPLHDYDMQLAYARELRKFIKREIKK